MELSLLARRSALVVPCDQPWAGSLSQTMRTWTRKACPLVDKRTRQSEEEMSGKFTYKEKIRRTQLAPLNSEFLKDARCMRVMAGIPEKGFFCEQRAMWWDRCQRTEPVPEDWTRPKSWWPKDFYPEEQWGMEKWKREYLKWAWMPGGESRQAATPTGPWPPRRGSPAPGEDLLTQLVGGLIRNWGLLETADRDIRWYLLTGYDGYLETGALTYPIEVEVDPMKGAAVTIKGLHPNVTAPELESIWQRIRWRLTPYALLWPDPFGEGRYQVKLRRKQQRDFFIYRKMEFEEVPFSEAFDKWLELHPEELKELNSDSSQDAVRKGYERLRDEIKAMQPKE